MAYDPIIHFYDNPGHPYWPNKNGSSGGETTLGSMQNPMCYVDLLPVVGEASYTDRAVASDVYVGSQHVIGPNYFEGEYFCSDIVAVASGARVTYQRMRELPVGEAITTDDISVNMYVITRDYEDNVLVYASVTESDVEPSLEIRHRYDGDESSYYDIFVTLTQPELDFDAGEILACYIDVSKGDWA